MSTPINIPFNFQVGFPVVAAQHNSNNTNIANFCTSLQNGTNFGTGVIGTATIAPGAITTALLADGNVTSIKIQSSVVLAGIPNIGTAIASTLTVGSTSVPIPANGVVVQGNVVYHMEINQQTLVIPTVNYTLALSDDGKLVEINSATAVNVTIPTNATVAFPVGTQITVLQVAAGQITFVPAPGATVIGNPGVKTRAIWTAGTLIQRAANTWVVVGDLAA